MRLNATLTVAALAGALAAPAASADVIKHVFNLDYEHVDAAGVTTLGSVRMSGLWFGEIVTTDDPAGAIDNPLYQNNGMNGQNPIYERGAAPGSGGWIAGIAIGVASLSSGHSEGVVHRDIATRNMLISTDTGDFSLDLDQVDSVLFVSDDTRAAYGPGPIRWMAPEDIRTRTYSGGRSIEPTLTILAGSSFTAEIIPSPGSALVLGGAGLLAARRRRG